MSLKGQYRHITLRHERHLLNNTAPTLAPGEAKFSSYFLPSLIAGEYKIQIDQTVQAVVDGPKQPAVPAKRTFEVLAPEWAISAANSDTTNVNNEDDSAVVLSTFPASGEAAPTFRTLPHIVLKDPQLPWTRTVSRKDFSDGNSIPWFAVIVFSADELELKQDVGAQYFSKVNATVNDTLGWDLVASDIPKIDHARVANFIPNASKPDQIAGTRTSVIPVVNNVFKKLFTVGDNPTEFDVSPFRFMSHVRTVSTAGTMSAARMDNDGDPSQSGTQTVAMVVSHRLGPTAITVPTPVLAHLVSLQGIDTKSLSVLTDRDHVLMTSLYSWTYTALPPGSPDVVSMLQHLGKKDAGLSVLRTDMTVDPPIQKSVGELSDSDLANLVTKRQVDGYTLTRYRTITGEQTAAIYRGPLTPTRVPYPLHKDVSFQSNFGTDLQILDPNLGLMDLSYASAWQLGKTMAMGDPAFTTALSRLRTEVHREALESVRKDIFKRLRAFDTPPADGSSDKIKPSVFSDTNPRVSYMPRQEIKADVVNIVKALNGVNETIHQTGTAFSTNRWRRRDPSLMPSTPADQESEADLFSLKSPHVFSQMPFHSLSYLEDGTANTTDGGPYNSHSIPNNTDYAVIQEWVLDRLHLAGIPAHYFLPDPSHVPLETLRFFHIDSNWLDAMVDGALSLANHLAAVPEEDYTRSSLKATLTRYLKTPLVDGYRQQIPAYGFILRSQLLVQFPDLAVSAEFTADKDDFHESEDWAHAKPKAPILVQRKLAPDMMLVLLDRLPPKLSSVTFTLPAHQQTFIAAFGLLDAQTADLRFKRIYATGADQPLPEQNEKERQKSLVLPSNTNPYKTSDVFDWDARTLKIEAYANLVHHNLQQYMPRKTEDYRHTTPTAAVFALQLNEPIYTLVITAEKPVVRGQTTEDDNESLDSWQILGEPKAFHFYPPPFPTDQLATKSQLPVPLKAASFTPTSIPLQLTPKSVSGQKSFETHNTTYRAEQPLLKIDRGLPLNPRGPIHPTDTPRFDFKIFRLGRPNDTAVSTNADRPYDLVFSIIRNKDTTPSGWPLRIMHFDLVIPIASRNSPRPPDKDIWQDRALFTSNSADGPAPTMLSNQRYNVLIQNWDVEKGKLYMSIVPRTTWGVHMRETVEASFVFPMAPVFDWAVPKGLTYPGTIEMKSYMLSDKTSDPKEQLTVYNHDAAFKLAREWPTS